MANFSANDHWFGRSDQQQESVMNWQPIETAPKDGTRVIVGWDDCAHLPMHVELARYKQGRGPDGGWCNTYGNPFGGDPTHWIPLPESPQISNRRA
jgi:hypothetical protein